MFSSQRGKPVLRREQNMALHFCVGVCAGQAAAAAAVGDITVAHVTYNHGCSWKCTVDSSSVSSRRGPCTCWLRLSQKTSLDPCENFTQGPCSGSFKELSYRALTGLSAHVQGGLFPCLGLDLPATDAAPRANLGKFRCIGRKLWAAERWQGTG